MTPPQRFPYKVGDKVVVEATVTDLEAGEPFGAVTVRIPEATDPAHILDGVEAICPQVIVHPVHIDLPENYVSEEGWYPSE